MTNDEFGICATVEVAIFKCKDVFLLNKYTNLSKIYFGRMYSQSATLYPSTMLIEFIFI